MRFNKSLILGAAISALTITSGVAQVQQDSSKTNENSITEYGFGLYNLNSFSLQYRIGTEKRVTRFMGYLSFNSNQTINTPEINSNLTNNYTYSKTTTPLNFNFGFNIANLKLIKINEKLGLQRGLQVGASLNAIETNKETDYPKSSTYVKNYSNNHTKSISLNLGYVIGFYYKCNSNIYVYAEVAPTISYINSLSNIDNFDVDANNTTHNVSATNSKTKQFQLSGLSNSGAMISLVYRLNQ